MTAEGSRKEPYLLKAIIGGVSCAIAGVVLNPIDVVKIRMQNSSSAYPWSERSMIAGMRRILSHEGVQGLCLGIPATVMRELTYSTIRMGAYEPILSLIQRTSHADNPSHAERVPSAAIKYISALLAGGLGEPKNFCLW